MTSFALEPFHTPDSQSSLVEVAPNYFRIFRGFIEEVLDKIPDNSTLEIVGLLDYSSIPKEEYILDRKIHFKACSDYRLEGICFNGRIKISGVVEIDCMIKIPSNLNNTTLITIEGTLAVTNALVLVSGDPSDEYESALKVSATGVLTIDKALLFFPEDDQVPFHFPVLIEGSLTGSGFLFAGNSGYLNSLDSYSAAIEVPSLVFNLTDSSFVKFDGTINCLGFVLISGSCINPKVFSLSTVSVHVGSNNVPAIVFTRVNNLIVRITELIAGVNRTGDSTNTHAAVEAYDSVTLRDAALPTFTGPIQDMTTKGCQITVANNIQTGFGDKTKNGDRFDGGLTTITAGFNAKIARTI